MTEADHFLGYARAQGRPGVRNLLLVLSVTGLTGPTARRIGASVAGSVVIDMPYGAGQLGLDATVHTRVLQGLAKNPNVGGALIIGADRPRVDAIGNAMRTVDRPCDTLVLDDCGHDALVLTDRGIRSAATLTRQMSCQHRTPQPLSALCIGLECGRSDPSSGLVSNPLVGLVTDALVDAGATAMFGETTEWLGAEHLLARRAVNKEVGHAIVAAARKREQRAADARIDLTGNNPGLTNIEAGLSSIEEKALGAIAKTGRRPISSVIGFGQAPVDCGLHAMDAAAYAPESLTGFVASGAQLLLFTTGVGNSYVNALAPTLKVSANPETSERLREQLDFACPAVFTGNATLANAAQDLMRVVAQVASGMQTWGEILGEGGLSFARYAESL